MTFVERSHIYKFSSPSWIILLMICREFVKRCHNWFYSPLHRKFTRCGGAVFIKCLYEQHVSGELSCSFCVFQVTMYTGYKQTHRSSWLAWSEGQRSLGAVLHSSNELDEISQRLCRDDSTINQEDGHGMLWKVMEFSKTIFPAWKVMKNNMVIDESWEMTVMSWIFL